VDGLGWDSTYDNYTWQVMRGSDPHNSKCLTSVHRIMKQSFKPIFDPNSNRDMIPSMVYSQETDTEDCRNFCTIALCRGGDVVCCAVVRFFGAFLAEAPLVATDFKVSDRQVENWELIYFVSSNRRNEVFLHSGRHVGKVIAVY